MASMRMAWKPERSERPAKSPRRSGSAGAGAVETADVSASSARPLDLFTRLSRTALLLEALQRECLEPCGLAFAEYSVLRILQTEPRRQLAPSRLAERIVRTTGAVTKLVDRLESAGLVARQRDENDGRGVQVQLTAAGNRLANAASRGYTAGRERILASLSKDEVEATLASLERLIELLEDDVAGVERRSR